MTAHPRVPRFSRRLWWTVGGGVALLIAFALYLRAEKQTDRAHDLRHQSFLLADELRQSSDDLTRMARTAVVTGNPVYQKYYQDILDIRDGQQPRPEEYQHIYWDLVAAGGPPPRPASAQTIALLALMRQVGFTEQEFQKLADAKASSDALTVTELEAMQLAQATGPEAEARRAKARLMLYDDRYHQAKAAIMRPISEFYRLMDQRTGAAVHAAETRATAFRLLLIGCGLGVLWMLWRVYTVLRDTLGGSVDTVYTQIAQMGSGDLSSAVPTKAGLENTVLGWLSAMRAQLNAMDRERTQAEAALRVSEARVRMKLDSILSPNGDLGALELADVLDVPAIQAAMDEFFKLTHIGVAIVDLQGRVLVGTGWQDICVQFHRVHPHTCRNCIESDTALSRGVALGTFKVYRCKNQMYDIATPIMVGGRHLGNVFLGQFFFDDEPPDREQFRAQARRYGFDEVEYLAALDRVPRWSRAKVDTAMSFYTQFAHLFSAVNYSNLQLARSVAERDTLLTALQDSETRFRRAVEEAPIPIMIHDEDGCILQLSEGWTHYSGYTLADLPTLGDWTERAYGARIGPEKNAIDRLFLLDATLNNGESSITAKDGSKRIWEFQTTPLGRIHQDKRVLLRLAVDITERKRLEEELQQQATTDPLTGLPNRRRFLDLTASALKQAFRLNRPLALALIDLDHFKSINDRYGHACGDQVLIAFTQICLNNVREMDVLARFGGDEFVLLFPETALHEASVVLERVRLALTAHPVDLSGTRVPMTLSAGIAGLAGASVPAVGALIDRADQVLYQAKAAGRNQVMVERASG